MKTFRPLIIGVLALSGSALAQMQHTPPRGGGAGGLATKQNVGPDPMVEKLVGNDVKTFAANLHQVNQAEIRLGQLAEKKAHNQEVREFGKDMVAAHTEADRQLMEVARNQGWNLSAKPSPKNETERALHNAHEATEAELKQLDGPLFDSTYMATMVAGHDGVILKLSFAQQQFRSTPLGSQLSQLIPVVTEHREHAYRVLGDLKPETAPMGVGGAGKGAPQTPTRKY
jgi:putative membrane protein